MRRFLEKFLYLSIVFKVISCENISKSNVVKKLDQADTYLDAFASLQSEKRPEKIWDKSKLNREYQDNSYNSPQYGSNYPNQQPQYVPPSYPTNGQPVYGPPANGPPPNGPPANLPPAYGPPANLPPAYGPPGNLPPSYGPPNYTPPPYGQVTQPFYGIPYSFLGGLIDKIKWKIDLFTIGKIILKLVLFKKLVSFIAIICLLLFIPWLKHKSDNHISGEVGGMRYL